MKRRFKIGCLLLLIIPVLVGLGLFFTAEPWPQAADTSLLKGPTAPEVERLTADNGHWHLRQLPKLFENAEKPFQNHLVEVQARKTKMKDVPTDVIGRMDDVREILQLLHETAAFETWLTPHAAFFDDEYPAGKLQDIYELGLLEARIQISTGRWDRAVEIISDQVILGSRPRHGLNLYQSGWALHVQITALENMRTLLEDDPPEDALLAWDKVLQHEMQATPSLADIYRNEAAQLRRALGEVGDQTLLPPWVLTVGNLLGSSPSVTADNVDQIYADHIACAEDPACMRFTGGPFAERILETPRHAFGPDPVGRILAADMHGDGGSNKLRLHRRVLGYMQAMRVVLAAHRFRKQHGAYPNTMAELSPDFLKDEPLPEPTLGPLLYQRTGATFTLGIEAHPKLYWPSP